MNIHHLESFNKDSFKKYLGEYIQQRRLDLGLTQKEVADQLGLTLRQFQQLESGKKKLNQELFEKIQTQLALDIEAVIQMTRITHVQYLMDYYRIIDENYPR